MGEVINLLKHIDVMLSLIFVEHGVFIFAFVLSKIRDWGEQ